MDVNGEIIRTGSQYDNQLTNKDRLCCVAIAVSGLDSAAQPVISFPYKVNILKVLFQPATSLPDLGESPTDYSTLELTTVADDTVIASLNLGALTTTALNSVEFTVSSTEALLAASTDLYMTNTETGSGQAVPEFKLTIYFEVI